VLSHLETMEEPTVVMEVEGGDRDVIGYARDGDDAVVALMRIRAGKLLARDHQFVENIEGERDEDVLESYLAGPYRLLARAGARAHASLRHRRPQRRRGVARAHEDPRAAARTAPRADRARAAECRHLLEEARSRARRTEERAGDPVYELQRQLGLQKVPRLVRVLRRLARAGHGHGRVVRLVPERRPHPREYRKFKVKTVEGIDDFASMKEVVGRYFQRRLDEGRALPISC
jgi:excinuclease ABC subunit C